MAACNPHRQLQMGSGIEETYTRQERERLAFDVLPAPHAMLECMWNYGSLTRYEYERYIGRMLSRVDYKQDVAPALILAIHEKICEWLHDSAVSLRDIERFRQLYLWFVQKLPRNMLVVNK